MCLVSFSTLCRPWKENVFSVSYCDLSYLYIGLLDPTLQIPILPLLGQSRQVDTGFATAIQYNFGYIILS